MQVVVYRDFPFGKEIIKSCLVFASWDAYMFLFIHLSLMVFPSHCNSKYHYISLGVLLPPPHKHTQSGFLLTSHWLFSPHKPVYLFFTMFILHMFVTVTVQIITGMFHFFSFLVINPYKYLSLTHFS